MSWRRTAAPGPVPDSPFFGRCRAVDASRRSGLTTRSWGSARERRHSDRSAWVGYRPFRQILQLTRAIRWPSQTTAGGRGGWYRRRDLKVPTGALSVLKRLCRRRASSHVSQGTSLCAWSRTSRSHSCESFASFPSFVSRYVDVPHYNSRARESSGSNSRARESSGRCTSRSRRAPGARGRSFTCQKSRVLR
jgi:hypothetical protein